jgi:hypothetical protein
MDLQIGASFSAFQTKVTRSIDSIQGFVGSSPGAANEAGIVSRELVELQAVAGLLADRAEPFDSGVALVPEQLWNKIRLLPASCDELLVRLDEAVLRERSGPERGTERVEGQVRTVGAFGRPLRHCRKAFSLAASALTM